MVNARPLTFLSSKWKTNVSNENSISFSYVTYSANLNRTNLLEWLSRHDNIICSIDMVSAYVHRYLFFSLSLSRSHSYIWSAHQCIYICIKKRKRTHSFQLYAYYVYQSNRLYVSLSLSLCYFVMMKQEDQQHLLN